MTDWGGIPDDRKKMAELERRIENLERRALSLTAPVTSGGCCDLFCCNSTPIDTLDIGEVGQYCSIDIDEQAGIGLRLDLDCMVVLESAGTGGVDAIVTFAVDGSVFVEEAREARGMTTSDIFTLSNTMVVDTLSSAPNVVVYVQNLNVTTINVLAVNLKVRVGPKDGSTACGEVAGT